MTIRNNKYILRFTYHVRVVDVLLHNQHGHKTCICCICKANILGIFRFQKSCIHDYILDPGRNTKE